MALHELKSISKGEDLRILAVNRLRCARVRVRLVGAKSTQDRYNRVFPR
jgi:hypothetical protein